jgi:hypothetical protein
MSFDATPRASAITSESALAAVSLTSATIAFFSSSPIATWLTPFVVIQAADNASVPPSVMNCLTICVGHQARACH